MPLRIDIFRSDVFRNLSSTVAAAAQSASGIAPTPGQISRLAFRNTPISPEILKYLDVHRLGYIAKRKSRVNVARKFEGGELIKEDMFRVHRSGDNWPFQRW